MLARAFPSRFRTPRGPTAPKSRPARFVPLHGERGMSTIGALQLDHPLRRCGALAAIRSPRRRHWALAGLGMTLGLGACGGGGGSSTQEMDLIAVSNGFGLLLPHQVLRLDGTGAPT